jgi:hypothetical protein
VGRESAAADRIAGCATRRNDFNGDLPFHYVFGGEGYISVFQQDDADHYKLLEKVQTAIGARTAGYFGKGKKGFDRFYLAVPARADHGAEVWIDTVQD